MAQTKLPTIYKLTSTGKIQHWSIVIENDTYYTISGQVGGKDTVSKPTKCKAKNIGQANETSAEQQAQKEAEAKRRLKLEGEYKLTQEECTGDVGFVKPMLAEKWEDRKDEVTYPVYSDKKYNGMRCIITKKGMYSRKGKPILSAPHIFKEVEHLFVTFPDIVLDGELYNHNLRDDLGALLSLVRQKKPTENDLKQSADIVKYYIYDAYNFYKVVADTKFSIRKQQLKLLFNGHIKSKSVVYVQSDYAENEEMLNTFLAGYLAEGYEGQMVRLDEAYQNKRTKNLLKRKEWQDEEFEVLFFEEGTGNASGMVGAVWCKLNTPTTVDGVYRDKFKANLKGSDEYSITLWKNKDEYVGKSATVKFHVYSPYGVPLYPYAIAFDREGAEGEVNEEDD